MSGVIRKSSNSLGHYKPEEATKLTIGGFNQNGRLAKPVSRRSRASKNAPIKFLTANVKNFRAVVQQLTGCQSENSSYKGPINLNFGAEVAEETDIYTASSIPMLHFNYLNHGSPVKQQHLEERKQYEDQESCCSAGDEGTNDYTASSNPMLEVNNYFNHQTDQVKEQHILDDYESSSSIGDAFLSAYSSPAPYSTMIEDLLAEQNIFLADFDGDYSPNGQADEDIHQTDRVKEHHIPEDYESSSSIGDAFLSAYPSPAPNSTMVEDLLAQQNIFLDDFDGDYSPNGQADEDIIFCDY